MGKGKKVDAVGQRVSFELQGVKVTGVVMATKQTTEYTIQTDGPLKASITVPIDAVKLI